MMLNPGHALFVAILAIPPIFVAVAQVAMIVRLMRYPFVERITKSNTPKDGSGFVNGTPLSM